MGATRGHGIVGHWRRWRQSRRDQHPARPIKYEINRCLIWGLTKGQNSALSQTAGNSSPLRRKDAIRVPAPSRATVDSRTRDAGKGRVLRRLNGVQSGAAGSVLTALCGSSAKTHPIDRVLNCMGEDMPPAGFISMNNAPARSSPRPEAVWGRYWGRDVLRRGGDYGAMRVFETEEPVVLGQRAHPPIKGVRGAGRVQTRTTNHLLGISSPLCAKVWARDADLDIIKIRARDRERNIKIRARDTERSGSAACGNTIHGSSAQLRWLRGCNRGHGQKRTSGNHQGFHQSSI
jgi:hypothetical protein